MPVIDVFVKRITSNSSSRPSSPQFSYQNKKDLDLDLDVSFVPNKRARARGNMVVRVNGIEYSEVPTGAFTDVRTSLLSHKLNILEAQGMLEVWLWNGAKDGVDIALTVGLTVSTIDENAERKN